MMASGAEDTRGFCGAAKYAGEIFYATLHLNKSILHASYRDDPAFL
jgi:hypothetical protein